MQQAHMQPTRLTATGAMAAAATQAIRLGRKADRTPYVVGVLAAVLSAASAYYYYRHDLILAYQDSFSHMEISRRVVAGLSPGIAQLGGVWLPVPQLLEDLLNWNFTLYRTGLAGALVSMAGYVVTTVYLYRLVALLTGGRRWPAIAGAAVFAVNANVLYQQATSMDELPFYAFTTAAVYYLVIWGSTKNARHLLTASIASMLAMLCRYEGWFLAGVYLACVALMARRLRYSWRDARGLALVPAIFGAALPAAGWLIYNYLIFGNPLNFENGPTSSAAQMAERHAYFKTVGNWPLTLEGYGYVLGSDLGLVVLALAVAGLAVFLWRERFSARSLPVLGLLCLVPFFLITLEMGAEPISVPSQGALLNYRFGLVVAIPAGILIGYLVSRLPWRRAVAAAAMATVIALAGLSGAAFQRHQVVLATEAAQDLWAQRLQVSAGDYVTRHTTGLILIDIVQNERVDYDVVDRSVYDGTKESGRNQWTAVLRDPTAFGVSVIVMRLPNPGEPPDMVYGALHGSPALKAHFRLAYRSSAYLIYRST